MDEKGFMRKIDCIAYEVEAKEDSLVHMTYS